MNQRAKKHLTKAKTYLAKGDEYYRKAALEIEAAMEADPNMTRQEAAEELGKQRNYASRLLLALARERETGEFVVDWESGSNKREEVAKRHLAQATPEEVSELVAEALQREDVIEHLAEDPEKAAKVVWAPGNVVESRIDEKAGIDRSGPRVGSGGSTALDGPLAQLTILEHLLKATELAIEHNLEAFLLDHIEDAVEQMQMSIAAGNPKQAVAELEAWLHEETKESDAA